MRECRQCKSAVEERFRFCPWCGATQRLKIVEYFSAHRLTDEDELRGLRVSRYFSRPGHVRFSVWNVGEVEAAVSLDEDEARRLAAFLRTSEPGARARLSHRLREDAGRLFEAFR